MTPRFEGVIAIDGPSGTGKSTVARALARRLAARYLDTGAMYRAATLAVLRAGVDPADPEAVVEVVRRVAIDVATNPDQPVVRLDGHRSGVRGVGRVWSTNAASGSAARIDQWRLGVRVVRHRRHRRRGSGHRIGGVAAGRRQGLSDRELR